MTHALQHIQMRHGTADEWLEFDPVLLVAETGWESDSGFTKTGNGTDTWSDLDYNGLGPTGPSGAVTAASLPTPGILYRGQFCTVTGAPGVADTLFVCLKGTDNAYTWVEQ